MTGAAGEHDSAYDGTKSLVDHLGSDDGQTFPVSLHGSLVNLSVANIRSHYGSRGIPVQVNIVGSVSPRVSQVLC